MEKSLVIMKKIIIVALALIPTLVFSQMPDTLIHRVKDLQLSKTYPSGVREFTLVPVDDTARAQIVVVKYTADKAAADVLVLKNTTIQQGVAIQGLQTTINGIQVVVPPLPKQIYDNTYTLTEADNGGTIYVYVTCTVTCPTLFAGFKCRIIRMGAASSAVVTINGSAIITNNAANSVYGYKFLRLQYAEADIQYVTNSQAILTGRISK